MGIKLWWSGKGGIWLARMRRGLALSAGGVFAAGLCAFFLSCWIGWVVQPMPGGGNQSAMREAPRSIQTTIKGAACLGIWAWQAQEKARSQELIGRSLLQAQPSAASSLGAELKFLACKALAVGLGAYSLWLWGLLASAIRVRLIMLGMTSNSQKSSMMLRAARFLLAHLIPAFGIYFAGMA